VLEQAHSSCSGGTHGLGEPRQTVQTLYRWCFQGRRQSEVNLGQTFMAAQSQAGPPFHRWKQYAQVLLLSNELMFVD